MTNILTSITELTLGMSAVIALLLVLLMWKGKTLKAKSRYIIWALVILRLAVPFSLGLMPSLFTLPALPVTEVTLPSAQDNSEGSTSADTAPQYSVALPTPGTENVLQQSPAVTDSVSTSPLIPDEGNVVQGNNSVIPNAPWEEKTPIGNVEVTPDTKVEADTTVQTPSAEQPVPDTEKAAVKIDVVAILFAVWLTGAVIYAAGSILSYAVYTRRVLKTSTPAESETMAIYESLCGKMNIKNRPRLLTSRVTDSPAAFGIFRKYIVLPELPLSLNSLELTLSHELTHVKRHDLILKLIAMAARSFHWFNPLVHYAARRCESECELSCDEAVLAGRDDEARTEYGETLVDILKFCRKRRGSLTTHFSPDKKAVKARLASILSGSGKKRGIVLVALCLALCIIAGAVIGFGFGTDVKVPAADTQTEETETDPGPDTESEPETDANETEPVPDTETVETDPAPEEVKSAFTVLPGSSENVALYENVTYYDAYTGSHILCVLLVAECDVKNFSVTKLTWSEELLVESEEIIHTIGGIKAGDAVMLNVDPVEIVGYTGISYEVDGEVFRAFPAMSGMEDGTPYLMDIDEYLSIDMIYPDVPKFEITVSEEYPISDALKALYGDKNVDPFLNMEEKAVTVYGLSTPVYLRFGDSFNLLSVAAFGNTLDLSETWSLNFTISPERLFLLVNDDAVFFTFNIHDFRVNTVAFTRNEATEFASENDGISTEFKLTDEGDTEYTRISMQFRKALTYNETAPLDYAKSRDDFYREVGKAYVKNGILVFDTPYLHETIDEAFDLDRIFAAYPLVYTGYSSVEEVLADNAMGTVTEDKLVMPDESYAGTWTLYSTYNYDYVKIDEITADSIKYRGYINKYYTFSGTAVLKDGEWVFGDGISTDYMGPDGITGRLQFTDDSVSIIYDSAVKYDDYYVRKPGHKDTFTLHISGHTLSDRIYACTTLQRLIGHYTLEFTTWDSSYVITPKVEICNGCNLSLDGKFTEYGTEDGWQYPVKVYRGEVDESLKETDPYIYSLEKRWATYVFDMGGGIHYSISLHCPSGATPYENEEEVLDSIAKGAVLTYTLSKPETNVTNTETVQIHENTYTWKDNGTASGTYDTDMGEEEYTLTYTADSDYKVSAVVAKVVGKFDAEELTLTAASGYAHVTGCTVVNEWGSDPAYPYVNPVTMLQSVIPNGMLTELEDRGAYDEIESLGRHYYFVIDLGTRDNEYLILSIKPTDIASVPEENDEKAVYNISRTAVITQWGDLSYDEEWIEANREIPDELPKFEAGEMKVYTAEEALEIHPHYVTEPPEYRAVYYWLPSSIQSYLVSREEAREWHVRYDLPNEALHSAPQEMTTVSFIKYFKIPKEEFIKACEATAERHQTLKNEYGYDITDEGYEIPNADVLYTFDNDIINDYYRR